MRRFCDPLIREIRYLTRKSQNLNIYLNQLLSKIGYELGICCCGSRLMKCAKKFGLLMVIQKIKLDIPNVISPSLNIAYAGETPS